MKVAEIRGAQFVNKGAELMLQAVTQHLHQQHPDWTPAINQDGTTAEERRALGLSPVFWRESHRHPGGRALYNAALRLNRRFGLVGARPDATGTGLRSVLARSREPGALFGDDVRVVLDASGFAYGDPWGPHNAAVSARLYARLQQRGGAVVLLPQQLGPFDDPAVRDAFRALSAVCDRIYARDRISLDIGRAAAVRPEIVQQCPDFTVLLHGVPPTDSTLAGRVVIVPNYKMFKATSERVGEAYRRFLVHSIKVLRERGEEPVVLIHEYSGKDHRIARELSEEVGALRIVEDADPIRLKGILGASRLVIGARFHSLVSSLSQAVPSIGTSWSHKYQMLFEEYGASDYLVHLPMERPAVEALLRRALDDDEQHRMRAMLAERATWNKEAVLTMWADVDRCIEAVASTP